MPPQLALLVGYGLIFWLIRKDMQVRHAGSWALLVPGAFIAIQASRPLSYWFNGAEWVNTGSFVLFIVASLIVLSRRHVDWGILVQRNKALCLLYFYFVASMLWSDIPALSLKRILKDIGCVLILMLFLTQANPAQAIRTVFVRVSYLLFPLSLVFIKYFPEIGRQPRNSGDSMFRGVAVHKNTLGVLLFVCGMFLLWDLHESWKKRHDRAHKQQFIIKLGVLGLGLMLLIQCDSKTSFLCLILGASLLWVIDRLIKMRNGKQVLILGLIVAGGLLILEQTIGLKEMVIRAVGRNPTLTGRTEIWSAVLAQGTDPLIGNGFWVFWDTARGERVSEDLARLTSAHNGYLELYLDGGIIGVGLLVLFLLVICKQVIDKSFIGDPVGKIGLVFWITSLIYNLSESSFLRLDFLWFTLLLTTIDYSCTFTKCMNAGESEEIVQSTTRSQNG